MPWIVSSSRGHGWAHVPHRCRGRGQGKQRSLAADRTTQSPAGGGSATRLVWEPFWCFIESQQCLGICARRRQSRGRERAQGLQVVGGACLFRRAGPWEVVSILRGAHTELSYELALTVESGLCRLHSMGRPLEHVLQRSDAVPTIFGHFQKCTHDAQPTLQDLHSNAPNQTLRQPRLTNANNDFRIAAKGNVTSQWLVDLRMRPYCASHICS